MSAKDVIWGRDDTMVGDAPVSAISDAAAPTAGQPIAVRSSEEQLGVRVDIVTANLKVYQTDLEVAGLFTLPESKLLVSFSCNL